MAKSKGKPRKPTPNQQEWRREVRRIQRLMQRARKRGFVFEPNIIPERPKRVTQAALRRIKAIKPEQIYAQSYQVVPETGEAIPGLVARKLERQEVARKARATRKANQEREKRERKKRERGKQKKLPATILADEDDIPDEAVIVLANIDDRIQQLKGQVEASGGRPTSKEMHIEQLDIVEGMIREAISQDGMEAVARRLQARAADVNEALFALTWQSKESLINVALARLSDIVFGGLSQAESESVTPQDEEVAEFFD